MIPAAIAFSIVAFAIEIVVLPRALRGKVKAHHAFLANAIAAISLLIAALCLHNRILAGWNSGLIALNLWLWWTHGGGDDTKKRLRALARKFTPVRRTAPQPA